MATRTVPEAARTIARLLADDSGSLGHGWPVFRTHRQGTDGCVSTFMAAMGFTTAVGAGTTVLTLSLGRSTRGEKLAALGVRDEIGLAWMGGCVTVCANSGAVHVEGATICTSTMSGIAKASHVDFAYDPITTQVMCRFDGGEITDGECIAVNVPRNALLFPIVLNEQVAAKVKHVRVDSIHGPVVKPRILRGPNLSVRSTTEAAHAAAVATAAVAVAETMQTAAPPAASSSETQARSECPEAVASRVGANAENQSSLLPSGTIDDAELDDTASADSACASVSLSAVSDHSLCLSEDSATDELAGLTAEEDCFANDTKDVSDADGHPAGSSGCAPGKQSVTPVPLTGRNAASAPGLHETAGSSFAWQDHQMSCELKSSASCPTREPRTSCFAQFARPGGTRALTSWEEHSAAAAGLQLCDSRSMRSAGGCKSLSCSFPAWVGTCSGSARRPPLSQPKPAAVRRPHTLVIRIPQ